MEKETDLMKKAKEVSSKKAKTETEKKKKKALTRQEINKKYYEKKRLLQEIDNKEVLDKKTIINESMYRVYEELTPNQILFLELYTLKMGNVSDACKAMGMTRRNISKWKETTPVMVELMEDIINGFIDLAEMKLREKISEGNLDAIKYYLNSQGKHRGYGEQAKEATDNSLTVVGFNFVSLESVAKETEPLDGVVIEDKKVEFIPPEPEFDDDDVFEIGSKKSEGYKKDLRVSQFKDLEAELSDDDE